MAVSPYTIPIHAEVELVQGSALAHRVRVLDPNGNAKSLFNGAASWTLRKGNFASFESTPKLEQDTDGAGSAGVAVTITDTIEAPYWHIVLEVDGSATLDLAEGGYVGEYWATDANGAAWPVLRGTYSVLKRVASAA